MNNIEMTVFGIVFIFAMTSIGAASVLFFKMEITKKTNAMFLGLASGIMIAASIWSLLLPAIEDAQFYLLNGMQWVPIAVGILCGTFFILFLDKILLKYTQNNFIMKDNANNSMLSAYKSLKLFFAVTLHNIPEGLAVGFAFGAAHSIGTSQAFLSAFFLSLGIGIQNIPEGAAVSLPMKSIIKKNSIAFLFGVFSGFVEPVFAILGYFLAGLLNFLQCWFLSFAAGGMIFVVIQDLIPEYSQEQKLGSLCFVAGFILMMVLDIAF